MNLCFQILLGVKMKIKNNKFIQSRKDKLSRICSRFDYKKLQKKGNISKIKNFGKKGSNYIHAICPF